MKVKERKENRRTETSHLCLVLRPCLSLRVLAPSPRLTWRGQTVALLASTDPGTGVTVPLVPALSLSVLVSLPALDLPSATNTFLGCLITPILSQLQHLFRLQPSLAQLCNDMTI